VDEGDDGRVFVFEDRGAVLGFAVVLPRDDGQAQLDGLFVEPEAWGRGIGRRLVDHALDAAREGGAIGLTLIANANALGFYEKCGFQVLAEVQTPTGRGVRMTRPLSPA
jgi:GNAT superfamily N-acetyltransferase